MNTNSLPKLPNISHTHGDLISSYLITDGNPAPFTKHIAVFEYPDCTRQFDGKDWTVTADKRPEAVAAIRASANHPAIQGGKNWMVC